MGVTTGAESPFCRFFPDHFNTNLGKPGSSENCSIGEQQSSRFCNITQKGKIPFGVTHVYNLVMRVGVGWVGVGGRAISIIEDQYKLMSREKIFFPSLARLSCSPMFGKPGNAEVHVYQ